MASTVDQIFIKIFIENVFRHYVFMEFLSIAKKNNCTLGLYFCLFIHDF